MLIRAAEPGDFPSIAALNNHFILHTAIHFGYEPVSPAAMETQWREQRERYPWLVAVVDGAFAGYCKAGVWRERSAYAWTPEAGIYVEERVRRRGVGAALYRRLFEALRAQGYQTVVGGITLPNEPSVRLHESVGFVHVGTVARAGWKFGRWHDVGFWQRALAEPGAEAAPIRPPRIEPVETA